MKKMLSALLAFLMICSFAFASSEKTVTNGLFTSDADDMLNVINWANVDITNGIIYGNVRSGLMLDAAYGTTIGENMFLAASYTGRGFGSKSKVTTTTISSSDPSIVGTTETTSVYNPQDFSVLIGFAPFGVKLSYGNTIYKNGSTDNSSFVGAAEFGMDMGKLDLTAGLGFTHHNGFTKTGSDVVHQIIGEDAIADGDFTNLPLLAGAANTYNVMTITAGAAYDLENNNTVGADFSTDIYMFKKDNVGAKGATSDAHYFNLYVTPSYTQKFFLGDNVKVAFGTDVQVGFYNAKAVRNYSYTVVDPVTVSTSFTSVHQQFSTTPFVNGAVEFGIGKRSAFVMGAASRIGTLYTGKDAYTLIATTTGSPIPEFNAATTESVSSESKGRYGSSVNLYTGYNFFVNDNITMDVRCDIFHNADATDSSIYTSFATVWNAKQTFGVTVKF